MYRIIYLCFLFLTLFSCEKNTTYNVNGTIIEIHEKDYKLLIDHEKIENFMEPMVMFFNIHKSIDMQTFNINDYVNFDLVITKDSHYSLNFKTINKKEEIIEDEFDFLNDTNDEYQELSTGDTLNTVLFSRINNELYTVSSPNKKLTIISYIFSRCPMPDMCPAIVSHNQFLAKSFKEEKNIEFILISFDYIHDTPKVLNKHYGNIEKEYSNIKFLSSTNHLNDLVQITKQSGLRFWGVEENNIGHTMRTIIIDENNVILKTYDGNNVLPGTIKEDIEKLTKLF